MGSDDRAATGPGPEMPGELWGVTVNDVFLAWSFGDGPAVYRDRDKAERAKARQQKRVGPNYSVAAVLVGVSPARLSAAEAESERLRADLWHHENERRRLEKIASDNRLLSEACREVEAERDTLREAARRAADEAGDLRDAVECLGRIGEMVGFGQAHWGKDDRARLVREVRDALAAIRSAGGLPDEGGGGGS